MTIIVDIDVPYERLYRKEFASVEEAVAWLKANTSKYEDNLDRVEMYEQPVYKDVYALVGNA